MSDRLSSLIGLAGILIGVFGVVSMVLNCLPFLTAGDGRIRFADRAFVLRTEPVPVSAVPASIAFAGEQP